MTDSDAPEPTTGRPIRRKLFPFPGVGSLGPAHGAADDAVAGPVLMSRVSGFPPLDGRGYLVISRGELKPGAPVAIGTMPRGIGGGVDEWRPGRIAEVDGIAGRCRYPECECERDSPCGAAS